MSRKILLVDGHSIANRAFYGLPLLTNSKGLHTNALLGFFNILLRTIDDVKPDALGIAFDLKTPTFRHELYPEYKGNRAGFPDELREQIPYLQDLLKDAGLKLLTKEGFEADDVLGTISKQHGEKGDEVMILSGDRDLLQLVDEKITLLIPKTKKGGSETEVYHVQEVTEKYGVGPEGYLVMKSLMGDASDNIPGVPSIGEKTASKIVSTYQDLENAIAHASEIKPPRAGQNLMEYQEQARLSLVLATIRTDCPDPGEVTDLTPEVFHTRSFIEGLRAFELKSLLSRIGTQPAEEEEPEGQIGLEEAQTVRADASADGPDDALRVHQFFHSLNQQKEKQLAVYPAKSGDGQVLGLSFASFDQQIYTEELSGECLEEILKVLHDPDIRKITFDAKQIQRWLLEMKTGAIEKPLSDLMLACYLLNATKGSYSVDEVSVAYLDQFIPTESDLLGQGVRKKTWEEIDEKKRSSFHRQYAKVLLDAYEKISEDLKKMDLIYVYEEIELPLTEVLASMETDGIRCESSVLEEIGAFLRSKIEELQKSIYEMADGPFNINSTKQLGSVLFEKLELPTGKKTKSGYSTSAEVLESLKAAHPIVGQILLYRQLTKLESTYVEGLKPFIAADGRIHPRFQQAVTATGRLSCTDPNLQNIPIREDLGRQLRRAFLPSGEDYFFMDADYSQIELRLLADMSEDENLIDAYVRGDDIHRLTASQVLHIPYDEITPQQRSSAKAVNFGIIYGISAFSLSSDLGISVQEAQEYINHYFIRFPKVKVFLDECVRSAKTTGYGKTKFGRIRQIEELKAKNFVQRSFGERVAKNMPIQGTAADIIKIAMNRVYARMKKEGLKSRLIVQVHDELLIEVYRPEKDQVKRILEEEMTGAVKLLVPLVVDIHTGENWYEAK
ncbi:MAG: DNA polymerase I [Firmicutes bacterium]|nr:DNA polymerase I [Bacillota bacterium]